MYLPLILAALLEVRQPQIDIIDSRDDNKISYIIVNNTCKVAVNKVELKDYDTVIDKVLKHCGL